MNAKRIILERLGSSRFQQPENFDKVAEGSGWVVYSGGNDWENCKTAAAVLFSGHEQNSRIWFKIKFPRHLKRFVDADSPDGPATGEVRAHADRAWKRWVRLAKEERKKDEEGMRKDWPEAFKSALGRQEMRKFVDEQGEDKTQWHETPNPHGL